MDKLLAYINALGRDDRSAFLAQVGTSEGYIRKACSAKEILRPELCTSIHQASDGAVTRQDLRPHDWLRIWPELAEVA